MKKINFVVRFALMFLFVAAFCGVVSAQQAQTSEGKPKAEVSKTERSNMSKGLVPEKEMGQPAQEEDSENQVEGVAKTPNDVSKTDQASTADTATASASKVDTTIEPNNDEPGDPIELEDSFDNEMKRGGQD